MVKLYYFNLPKYIKHLYMADWQENGVGLLHISSNFHTYQPYVYIMSGCWSSSGLLGKPCPGCKIILLAIAHSAKLILLFLLSFLLFLLSLFCINLESHEFYRYMFLSHIAFVIIIPHYLCVSLTPTNSYFPISGLLSMLSNFVLQMILMPGVASPWSTQLIGEAGVV